MTILITGATGLIGKALTNKFIESGHNVNYLTTRKNAIVKEARKKGFLWNPKNNEIDLDSLKEVTVIIHLAGASVPKRWTSGCKKEIVESRISAAQVLFEALKSGEHTVAHFISASGISIYPASFTKLYTEDTPEVANDFLGKVVTAWETAADMFTSLEIDVAKVRTGVVLTANEGAYTKIEKPIKIGVGSAIGSGKQYLPWIHIDDIVGIYEHIIANNLKGVYNAVAPTPITNNTLSKKIAERYGKTIWLPNIPAFVLKFALGEMATIVLDGQQVSPEKLQKANYAFTHSTIDSALDQLISKKKDS